MRRWNCWTPQEEALRRADEERRRADAERRRADAERRVQQEVDAFVRRQIDAAEQGVPRDTLQSGGLGPQMVRMAAGRFQYLGPQEAVWVSMERPFAIAKYEVTRGEFARFADSSRYRTEAERFTDDNVCPQELLRNQRRTWRRPRFSQTDAHPVVCVTIRDAMAYAEWLSEETGHLYRLPSSAEWQYAVRAGSEEALLYIERNERNNCGRGNLEEHPRGARIICTDGAQWTAPVGRFPPNPRRTSRHDRQRRGMGSCLRAPHSEH